MTEKRYYSSPLGIVKGPQPLDCNPQDRLCRPEDSFCGASLAMREQKEIPCGFYGRERSDQ